MNMTAATKKTALAGMFLALGLVLPFVTGQIQTIGNMLLPMHFPVILCGLICGWQYGALCGFVLPLLRHVLFGMPPMPGAISMAFELCTYGAVAGLVYSRFSAKNLKAVYVSLIASMLAGRLVWGVVSAAIFSAMSMPFTLAMFVASAFTNSIPGIVLQLIVIPLIMSALQKTGRAAR